MLKIHSCVNTTSYQKVSRLVLLRANRWQQDVACSGRSISELHTELYLVRSWCPLGKSWSVFLGSGICCSLRFCHVREFSSDFFAKSAVMCIDISDRRTRPSIDWSTKMFSSCLRENVRRRRTGLWSANIRLYTTPRHHNRHPDTTTYSVIRF